MARNTGWNNSKYAIKASKKGYNGERLMIHKINKHGVFMTVDDDGEKYRNWYTPRYDIVPEGTYNQDVQGKRLPYIVYKNDVYSIDDFKEWDKTV